MFEITFDMSTSRLLGMPRKTNRQILEDAANLIEARGMCKGASLGSSGTMCMNQAIIEASGKWSEPDNVRVWHYAEFDEDLDACRRAVLDTVGPEKVQQVQETVGRFIDEGDAADLSVMAKICVINNYVINDTTDAADTLRKAALKAA